ncbi:hypothetical protein [Nonomuraea dietziae]|uniref:hypothetical protein n=1 Tax=Nonomuraea dietziae TaxID=65515 RepID=UPI003448BB1D
MRLFLAVAALLAASACASAEPATAPAPAPVTSVPGTVSGQGSRPAGRDQPMPPISGRPLAPGSGLRLLVTGDGGAYRLDVGTGARTPVTGLPGEALVWGMRAGARELLVTTRPDSSAAGDLYVLRGATARRLGDALFAFAAADGRGVWALQRVKGERCRLRLLDFEGEALRPALPFACSAAPSQDTPRGLLARDDGAGLTRLLDGATGKEVFGARDLHAVTRYLALVSDAEGPALVDVGSGSSVPLDWPATEGQPSRTAVSPDGRRIAMWFADPAWPGPRQYLDVQVLDLATRAWTRLPSMPVPASLKTTSMAWTGDGRLVLAGRFVTTSGVLPAESDHAAHVVAWRPGESELSLRRIELPPGALATLSP